MSFLPIFRLKKILLLELHLPLLACIVFLVREIHSRGENENGSCTHHPEVRRSPEREV